MRPSVTVTYWRWGPEPKRVVLLASTARVGQPGAAEVWGAESGGRVLLQREEHVAALRGGQGVELSDGTKWVVKRPGCGCQVPGPLRGFAPRVEAEQPEPA